MVVAVGVTVAEPESALPLPMPGVMVTRSGVRGHPGQRGTLAGGDSGRVRVELRDRRCAVGATAETEVVVDGDHVIGIRHRQAEAIGLAGRGGEGGGGRRRSSRASPSGRRSASTDR